MKICMLSELFFPFQLGGAEKRYYEIAKRLAKRHEVTVYSLKLRGCEDYEIKDNIEIIRIGSKHPNNRRAFLPLMTYFPFFSALKDYDVIDANQGIASFAGVFSFVKKPIVATFHDIYWNDWKYYFRRPYSYFGKFLEFSWSKLKYDLVIANSSQTREKLERLGFKNIEVICSGIDLDFIKKIKRKKSKEIIYVGRLVNYKNLDILIKAVGKSNIGLTVVGEGEERENLERLAKNLGADVEFLGFLDEERKIAMIKGAKIFVNPSSVEGFGLVALEAMACGTPTIVYDLPCYKDFSDDNLISFNDLSPDALSKVIEDLLDDRKRRNKLISNGRKTASRFSWDEIAKKVEKAYENLLMKN